MSETESTSDEPCVGQVWADNDWRAEGRTIRLTMVDARYVHGVVVTDRKSVVQPTVGRPVRLLRTRLRPTSTGYRLLAPGASS